MVAGQDFIQHDGHVGDGVGNDVGAVLDRAQEHAKDVVRTTRGVLVQLGGDDIIARTQSVGWEGQDFSRTLR